MHVDVIEIKDLNRAMLADLAASAREEGFRFVDRLLDDYEDGTNRFDKPGEALFVAKKDGAVVGVCGLNLNPYADDPQVGRVRRMYVLPAYRGRAVGRQLLERVIQRARLRFSELMLRTNDAPAAAFYERLGFEPITHVADTTHRLSLSKVRIRRTGPRPTAVWAFAIAQVLQFVVLQVRSAIDGNLVFSLAWSLVITAITIALVWRGTRAGWSIVLGLTILFLPFGVQVARASDLGAAVFFLECIGLVCLLTPATIRWVWRPPTTVPDAR